MVSNKEKRGAEGAASPSPSGLDSVKKKKIWDYSKSMAEQYNSDDSIEFPPSPVYSLFEQSDSDDFAHPQTLMKTWEYPKKDYAEDYRKQTLRCAVKSLEYYNKEKGTNYELVEALYSNGFLMPFGITFHCNFEAKSTNQNSKVFFGELLIDSDTTVTYVVTYCDILNGESPGCKKCGKNSRIKHPPSGFKVQSYYAIESSAEMDAAPSPSKLDSVEKKKTWDYSKSLLEQGYYSDDFEDPQSPVYPLFDVDPGEEKTWKHLQYGVKNFEYPKKDYTEEYRKQNVRCAEKSLEYYNKEKGTNYELVEALSSNGMFKAYGTAYHCNFEAKSTNKNGRSSSKLFFGELLVDSSTVTYIVTYCDILKGKSHGCKDCGKNSRIKHPPSGLLSRSIGDVPYAICTRSRTRSRVYT